MGNDNSLLLDKLRNALAKDKLFVITGAGVSAGIERDKGGELPSWGNLVRNVKLIASKELSKLSIEKRDLLDRLTPEGHMDDVHGDALIEASQIIEEIIQTKQFSKWIGEETKEKSKSANTYHFDIADLSPRGIITFNYDQCHENAFESKGLSYKKILYTDNDKLRQQLNDGFEKPTMILKAHGCVSSPSSLILTSSSYSRILNEHRVYRAVMQHVLSRYTILIVGFALRDRDFDQMLNTIEKDFGSSVQDHIVIMKQASKSKEPESEKVRYKNIADYAVLEARYGLKVLTVDEFKEIPLLLKSIKDSGGSWISQLLNETVSDNATIKKSARKNIQNLSDIGKEQLKELLINALKENETDIFTRSEQLYSLGLLKSHDYRVIELFINECEEQSASANLNSDKNGHIECIAHALVGLRAMTITDDKILKAAKSRLLSDELIERLRLLDEYLERTDDNPRLVNYAKSAFAEIFARSQFYSRSV